MFSRVFHDWERRLASVTKDRTVRPFDWGLDWMPSNGHGPDAAPGEILRDWVAEILSDTPAFFHVPEAWTFDFAPGPGAREGVVTFPSAFTTPHRENNVVHARFFDARPGKAQGRAVVVLPQWNADVQGHVGLCRVLNRFGLAALRLTLPYHDERMPPELRRADYIVSSNIARTIQVCRQAVMDARLAVTWLRERGFDRIAILGTSLGSCLSMLTAAHDSRIAVQALNHISPFFADVVWRGLSTSHVRAGLASHIDLDQLRALWMPISPLQYLDRVRNTRTLLVYARYDLTFPVDLSHVLVNEFRRRSIPHEVAVLPCGHYTTGLTPFKYLDGWTLGNFLRRSL
jgi:dienelactone hydrolase